MGYSDIKKIKKYYKILGNEKVTKNLLDMN